VKPPIWYYNLFLKYYKTPYPLAGRRDELTALITFSPSVDFLKTYNQIISPPISVKNNTKIIPYRLGRIVSIFIFKKKNRRHFREKYVKCKNNFTAR
ncbi:MAG: hypothetical protein LBC92_01060, partial [Rickettsiales bacterium]|nr:hypothetical protein [Rickettsiales bacterium]